MDEVALELYPPARESVEDRDWLRAARRGETWALERLYREHHQDVYRLCFRILGRAEDAEDTMQAAFVRAFRGIGGFHGGSAARTWLYRIAVNQAVSHLGRRSTEAQPLDAELPAPTPGLPIADRLAVNAALQKLRSDQRILLVLQFWEELSYQEMATVMGVSMPTLKMRLKRAKDEFRKHYEER